MVFGEQQMSVWLDCVVGWGWGALQTLIPGFLSAPQDPTEALNTTHPQVLLLYLL